MSLLLDALKKAAEKKAKKDAENSVHSDQTEVEDTRQLAQSDDATQIEQTQFETQIEATEYDSTEVQTRVDSTEIDETDLQTELDTRFDASGTVDDLSETVLDADPTILDDDALQNEQIQTETSIEATEYDSTEVRTQVDATETVSDTEHTMVDNTELETQLDTTIADQDSPTLTEEDRTLLIVDDEDDEVVLGSSIDADAEITEIDSTDTYSIPQTQFPETTAELTSNDVTDFLGDGLMGKDATLEVSEQKGSSSGDTTITNPDALSLTDIELDKENQEYNDFDNPEQDHAEGTHSLRLDDVPQLESGGPSSDETTASTVDIDKLTNDQTITVKSTTATRTFAPDNYDRTLLKFTDTDAAGIFPGMKSEKDDSVMTPEYAKRVFLSKSRGAKTQNYKMYVAIGVIVLALVFFWGVFQVEDEAENIDNSLVRLKRDPMPGVISTKAARKENLFAETGSEVDEKVIELISSAGDESESGEVTGKVVSAQVVPEPDVMESESVSPDTSASGEHGVVEMKSSNLASYTIQQKAPVATQILTEKSGESESSSSALKISSTSSVSKVDELLVTAYTRYEAGDVVESRRIYDQVLSMDQNNRDAQLGRAAIHVIDKEYEQAIAMYQDVLTENPKDTVAIASLISVANIKPQTGETQLKSLLREQPETAYLHFALGNVYGSQRRWTEAQSSYFTAFEHKPDDPNYAYNLAVSLEHINKPQAAVSYYQRALDNQANKKATFDSQLVAQRIEVLTQ